uniref:Coiled-coil-helix-coiled-coil-helix domain-containing protein 5 n=1 Tax=Apteryx owenii TaxID=8824 RepID=A0A8B9QER3_APTOW
QLLGYLFWAWAETGLGRLVCRVPAAGRWGAESPVLSRSPIVQQIRQDCAEPFAAFEQCLKENQASVTNCTDHVNQFLLCADQVNPVMSPPPQEPEPLCYYLLSLTH